jgi:hypothetical protein
VGEQRKRAVFPALRQAPIPALHVASPTSPAAWLLPCQTLV